MKPSSSPTSAKPPTGQELLARLAVEPWSLGFFEAMRRLERTFVDHPRWGEGRLPAHEPLRLGQTATLGFAASELAKLVAKDGEAPRLEVNFFGLTGAQGPMPLAFSKYVRDRERRYNDPTAKAFLDIFHHRLLSLLYRAWAAGRPTVDLDRGQGSFGAKLAAAFGGAGDLAHRPPGAANLAGHLARVNRSAEGLRAILRQELRVEVAIGEFTGRRMGLTRSDRLRLLSPARDSGTPRSKRRAYSEPSRLGQTAVLGSTWFDPQQRFRLRLGPMSWSRYQAFLPDAPRSHRRPRRSSATQRLIEWVRTYAEPGMDFDARLVLRSNELPAPVLGGRDGRLGHSTWLGGAGAAPVDRDDLVLRPDVN